MNGSSELKERERTGQRRVNVDSVKRREEQEVWVRRCDIL